MFQTKLFKKYFPFNKIKISQIEDFDKEKLIKMCRKTESEIRGESFRLCKIRGCFPIRGMFFSLSKLIEILQGYEVITPEDVNIMNMVLFMNQYIFPISFWIKPSLPGKYWTN